MYLSWMYFILSKCLLACVPKYTSKNFKKLIKRETSPVKWNQSKFKSAQLFYFYYFSPLKAHKGWKMNMSGFPLISQEIWYFIRFHQQSSQALNAWEPNYQRDFPLNFYIPHQGARHKSVLRGALDCLECTPDILVIALDHYKVRHYLEHREPDM